MVDQARNGRIVRLTVYISKSSPSPEKYATATFDRARPDHGYLVLVHFGRLNDGVHAVIRELGHYVVLKIKGTGVGGLVHVLSFGGYEKSRKLPRHLIGFVRLQDHWNNCLSLFCRVRVRWTSDAQHFSPTEIYVVYMKMIESRGNQENSRQFPRSRDRCMSMFDIMFNIIAVTLQRRRQFALLAN